MNAPRISSTFQGWVNETYYRINHFKSTYDTHKTVIDEIKPFTKTTKRLQTRIRRPNLPQYKLDKRRPNMRNKRYTYKNTNNMIIIIDKQTNKNYKLKLKVDKNNLQTIHELLKILNHNNRTIQSLLNANNIYEHTPQKCAEIIDLIEE